MKVIKASAKTRLEIAEYDMDDEVYGNLSHLFSARKFVKLPNGVEVCAGVGIVASSIVEKFVNKLKDLGEHRVEASMYVPKVTTFFGDYAEGKASSRGQFFEVRDYDLKLTITFDSLNRVITIFRNDRLYEDA